LITFFISECEKLEGEASNYSDRIYVLKQFALSDVYTSRILEIEMKKILATTSSAPFTAVPLSLG
jgi:hypothetical protein|tara:strand:+ start:457 stop:651 length:195 start_codon:yes stop_codon:yes gene_type:complete